MREGFFPVAYVELIGLAAEAPAKKSTVTKETNTTSDNKAVAAPVAGYMLAANDTNKEDPSLEEIGYGEIIEEFDPEVKGMVLIIVLHR